MSHTAAVFADRHSTRAALEQLVQAGFSRSAIGLAMSQRTLEREFFDSWPAWAGSSSQSLSSLRRIPGALLGAVLDGLAACAAADGTTLRVGGPFRRAILVPGSLAAVLVALGMAARDAQAADARVRDGAIVVGVETSNERVVLASQLLELSGGASLPPA